MSAWRWKNVRALLRQRGAAVPVRPRVEFWADFAARARYVPQTGEAVEFGVDRAAWRRIVTAAATALLLAVVMVWTQRAHWAASNAGGSTVKRIEVLAPHTGVVILNPEDERSGSATIVWVVGMENG
jgi:hypothetical protein